MRLLPRIALSLLVFGGLAAGQTYPPGQYPPGQYPPGQYPGQYPPSNRLPGGIPVPEIKLPRRKDKSEKEGDAKITLSSVEGSLRKLGAKDLLLQTRRDVLRFRLLAKTSFRNKAGEPVRDSLLSPGDQLSVQVNPDDEETAIRVILLRSGNASERAAAERPIAENDIRPPSPDDLGKPRTVSTGRSPDEGNREGYPIDPEPPEAAPASPGPAPSGSPDSRLISDDKILSDARAASATFTDSLPSFLVQQATSRYFSTSGPKLWRLLDTVTAELAYANGKEEYRNIEVDGRPPNRPVDQTGSWSTGEFATTLDDLLSEDTEADFRRRGEATIASRSAVVYDFTVAQAKSHWTIIAPDKREYSPAYRGAIWIDKETRRVLRIEQRTAEMPPDFPVGQAESILDYAYVLIDQKPYLLPARGENIGCTNGTGACTRNVIEFRNYRKFTAESSVKF